MDCRNFIVVVQEQLKNCLDKTNPQLLAVCSLNMERAGALLAEVLKLLFIAGSVLMVLEH